MNFLAEILPGDIALVNGTEYTVVSVEPDRIYISSSDTGTTSLLVLVNNQWQVAGYDVPHIIEFFPALNLSGIPELDQEILLQLNGAQLNEVCQGNEYLQSVCSDGYFWKRKVSKDFGAEVLEHKPENESFREQYFYLSSGLGTPRIQVERGRIDGYMVECKRRHNGNPTCGDYAINFVGEAAANGHLDMIKWMHAQGIPMIDIRHGINPADRAIGTGQLHIVEWYRLNGIMPTGRENGTAAKGGHLNSLIWLMDNNILTIEHLQTHEGTMLANEAAEGGSVNVLEWLSRFNVYPDKRGVRKANDEVLRWLAGKPRAIYSDWAQFELDKHEF